MKLNLIMNIAGWKCAQSFARYNQKEIDDPNVVAENNLDIE